MWWRFRMFCWRLLDYMLGWPNRLWRLGKWMLWIDSPRGKHTFLRWLSGTVLLLTDLTPVGLLYETILDGVKLKTRRMNAKEIDIAKSVFGNHFPFHLVSIDPYSFPVKKKRTMAYVSLHTIHFYIEIPAAVFVHELVHIWQYQRYGSIYISEAIWAQKWGGGYNYGGLEPLLKYSEGKGLSAFNFEQQADIIEEYYRWKNNLPLQWAINVPGIGNVLEKYKNQIQM